ncbi:unnamed protein product [Ilex paraguariensis]|uniref:DUF7870 domain-containing protein n=1 Tax=Ilex paraguariensis TaxID=185542 RepID=A0ABC8U8Q6_9AQUA
MDLERGYRFRNETKMKGVGIGLNSATLLIIKVPDSRFLRLMSRSLFLAIVILTLPSIMSIIRGSSSAFYDSDVGYDVIDFDLLPFVFRDLADEGLLKKGLKGLILSSAIGDPEEISQFLVDNDISLVIGSDLGRQSLIPKETFDFVFTPSFQDAKFLDRVLKIGGIVVMQLSNDHPDKFQQQANYKIVYIRRFDSTVVAMRKIDVVDGLAKSPTKQRLCGITEEAKKAALGGLEDVLLEPPRQALAKSSNGSRKIKFLPNLLGDSLESYQRRIFISDEKAGVLEWFHENYPMGNQQFEIYNLEFEMYEADKVDKGSLSRIRLRQLGCLSG